MKTLFHIALLCLLSLLPYSAIYAQEPAPEENYILLLNSANFGESWSDVILESLVNGVSKEGMTVKTDELLVPVLKTVEEARGKLDTLLRRYPVPPRAVIFIGDPGWLVSRPLFDKEWKDIPTLICYSRDRMPMRTEDLLAGRLNDKTLFPAEEVMKGYNVTVLRQPSYIRETVQAMQRMLPRMERVAFISDHRYISLRVRDEVSTAIRDYFPDLKFESLSTPELTTEELLDKLSEYDDRVGLIYYSWFVTQNKTQYSYLDDNVQKVLFGFTRTPIFSLADRDYEVGDFAGGYYIPAPEFAKEVISTVHSMLSGTPARDIPWRDGGTPALYLNYAHLEQHNVPTALFPREAIYSQTPPGFFEKYKFQLLAGASLFLLALVGGALWLRLLLQRQSQLQREYRLSSQYRRLVDNMPVIYIRKQMIGDGDFVFLDVNTAFETVFGCTREQVVNNRFSQVKSTCVRIRNLAEDPDSDAFTVDTDQGERYFTRLTFSSSEAGVEDTFCIDRTEEHQAQLRMEKHNREREELYEKYKLVLRATELIPWTWDKQAGQIDCDFEYTSTNFSIKDNRLVIPEGNYYDVVHPDDRESLRKAYQDLEEGRTDILQREYRVAIVSDKPDQYYWVKSSAIVKDWDAAYRPLVLVGASQLIDAQKALEQDLREAKEQAEESNRLKSAFLANMSHEIRTPLNAIVGFSSVLATSDIEDSADRQTYMHLVQENNDLLLKLISDILDLSKIEAGMFEFNFGSVDVDQMCEEAICSLSLKVVNRPIELRFTRHEPPCLILGDKVRLLQVITNFLTNALKFTEKGYIALDYTVSDGYIRFEVEDTGFGIEPAQQATIFDRFVKLNSFAQGTGLGLSICKLIVEQMGGNIGVESEKGLGSRFWFSVPVGVCDGSESMGPDQAIVVDPIAEGVRPTLLIAEDVDSNFLLISLMLRKEYEIIRASNGEEAVRMCGEARPDAVLMDIKMPVMDGIEASIRIRKIYPSLPIIAVTTFDSERDRKRAFEAGCNDYMAKPLSGEKMRQRLRQLLRRG